jgi:hypothetical protein
LLVCIRYNKCFRNRTIQLLYLFLRKT